MDSPQPPTTPVPALSTQTSLVQLPVVSSAASTQVPSIVTVPIPVLPPAEGTYAYIAVKSSVYSADSAVFGLNNDEVRALSNRHAMASTRIENGLLIKAPAMPLINTLSQLGYKVICSTGDSEIVWTLQREI